MFYLFSPLYKAEILDHIILCVVFRRYLLSCGDQLRAKINFREYTVKLSLSEILLVLITFAIAENFGEILVNLWWNFLNLTPFWSFLIDISTSPIWKFILAGISFCEWHWKCYFTRINFCERQKKLAKSQKFPRNFSNKVDQSRSQYFVLLDWCFDIYPPDRLILNGWSLADLIRSWIF